MTSSRSTDNHRVIEARHYDDGTGTGWTYRAVTPALPWNTAQAEWDRLDRTRPVLPYGVLRTRVYYMAARPAGAKRGTYYALTGYGRLMARRIVQLRSDGSTL